MVFIITGAAESYRNIVGQFLAESLGWEFVDASSLGLPNDVDQPKHLGPFANPDASLRVQALSAAINLWIYEWRDVVVSSPVPTEKDRRHLSGISSLVKIVCLEELQASDRPRFSDHLLGVAISQPPAGPHTSRDRQQHAFTLGLPRPVEEIIADLTALVMS